MCFVHRCGVLPLLVFLSMLSLPLSTSIDVYSPIASAFPPLRKDVKHQADRRSAWFGRACCEFSAAAAPVALATCASAVVLVQSRRRQPLLAQQVSSRSAQSSPSPDVGRPRVNLPPRSSLVVRPKKTPLEEEWGLDSEQDDSERGSSDRCNFICLAEELDLDRVPAVWAEAAGCGAVPGAVARRLSADVCALQLEDGRLVFAFRFGSIVTWGMHPDELRRVRRLVRRCAQFQGSSGSLPDVDVQQDYMSFEVPPPSSSETEEQKEEESDDDEESIAPSIKEDRIVLNSRSLDEALGYSYALAQSVKLAVFEDTVDSAIERARNIPEALAQYGEVTMDDSLVKKQVGEIFVTKCSMTLQSDILDTPEIIWENDRYDGKYNYCRKYLEIPKRVDILNQRLQVLTDIYSFLQAQLEVQHANDLEVIIIILILVEILIEIFHMSPIYTTRTASFTSGFLLVVGALATWQWNNKGSFAMVKKSSMTGGSGSRFARFLKDRAGSTYRPLLLGVICLGAWLMVRSVAVRSACSVPASMALLLPLRRRQKQPPAAAESAEKDVSDNDTAAPAASGARHSWSGILHRLQSGFRGGRRGRLTGRWAEKQPAPPHASGQHAAVAHAPGTAARRMRTSLAALRRQTVGTDPEANADGATRAQLLTQVGRLLQKRDWMWLWTGCGALLASSVVELLMPPLVASALFTAVERAAPRALVSKCVQLVFLAVAYGATNGLRAFAFLTAQNRFVRRLRERAFSLLLRRKMAYHDEVGSSELASRLVSDCQSVFQSLDDALNFMLRSGIVAGFGYIALWRLSPRVTLSVTTILMMLVVCTERYGKLNRAASCRTQDELAELSRIINEGLGQLRTVRSLDAEEVHQSLYIRQNARVFDAQLFRGRAFAVFNASNSGLTSLMRAVALLVGGLLALAPNSQVSGEALAAYLLYLDLVVESVRDLGDEWSSAMGALGSGERVLRIVGDPLPPEEGEQQLSSVEGSLKFDNVSFCYPSRPTRQVLSEVSLEFEAGKVTALVGTSGSGKSSIINLVQGMYEANAGHVRLDGTDVRRLDESWLRRQLGVVGQEPSLFRGTVAENIAWGLDLDLSSEEDMARVHAAAETACAAGFINKLPLGYNTVLGDGRLLSGGERQRVAIARAVIRDPAVLILDEATSALDATAAKQVSEALDAAQWSPRLQRRRTVIVIAHRLSTVLSSDKIIVLGHGRVLDEGTHEELMQRDGSYARLVEDQRLPTDHTPRI
eukprot:TRINITY_DN92353_c0_g1_i1.p1 TRINITY_DN92353_c0_g1~~TRINITY_DN92353_c0_g1_i1.p1  ORF type:complete len:1242 (-),score=238.72 TRINITY_DN92353_c0_g1_i1:18-3743(-)